MEQGYFYIIPAELVEGGDHAKALLYGLITSLVRRNGQCKASNKFLAQKLGRKDGSVISAYLSELQKEGWISITLENQGNDRTIEIALRKKPIPPSEKTEGYPSEISEDSNINTSNIKSKKASALASAIPGVVTGDQYQPDGNRPKRAKRTRTPAQEEAFRRQLDLDKFIVHYRQEAKRVHSLSYLDRGEDLNPKIRRQFSNAYSKIGEELMDFIDWVMADTETWHSYDPENCVTDKMIRRYRNRDAIEKLKPKSKKQRILVLGKKGGEEK